MLGFSSIAYFPIGMGPLPFVFAYTTRVVVSQTIAVAVKII